ncbi:hypothetical protein HP439_18690 [Sphingobacterium shayense]|uniref:hypothetical protein n=1 Tax=Sphingobacterium shayense TaxID=626343 RepID=UPI001552D1A4|nr:hypothetical protein [Sphingobacterium shayense]NQD72755.1 hypothetical protein [Sphingobacterium shayense]
MSINFNKYKRQRIYRPVSRYIQTVYIRQPIAEINQNSRATGGVILQQLPVCCTGMYFRDTIVIPKVIPCSLPNESLHNRSPSKRFLPINPRSHFDVVPIPGSYRLKKQSINLTTVEGLCCARGSVRRLALEPPDNIDTKNSPNTECKER